MGGEEAIEVPAKDARWGEGRDHVFLQLLGVLGHAVLVLKPEEEGVAEGRVLPHHRVLAVANVGAGHGHHGPEALLGDGGALVIAAQVKRWGGHLVGGAVDVDEMHEAGEVFHVATHCQRALPLTAALQEPDAAELVPGVIAGIPATGCRRCGRQRTVAPSGPQNLTEAIEGSLEARGKLPFVRLFAPLNEATTLAVVPILVNLIEKKNYALKLSNPRTTIS